MSLRAPLILGMGLVAIVLVGTAIAITRATQANLLDQVDERLKTAAQQGPQFPHDDGLRGRQPAPVNDAYFAVFFPNGSVEEEFHSYYGSTKALADPALPSDRFSHSTDGRPFTVASDDSGPRYRAVVAARPDGGFVAV